MAERDRWRDLGSLVEPEWSRERAAQVEARIHAAARRKGRARKAFAVAALAAAVAITAVWLWPAGLSRQPSGRHATKAATDPTEDVVTAIGAETRLRALGEAGSGYELLAGHARFEVSPRTRGESFTVRAGSVVVEVIGTRFDVALLEHGARVTVFEGRVRARWDGGSRLLDAGDAAVLPPPPTDAPATGAAAPAGDPPVEEERSEGSAPRSLPVRWRTLAEHGDFAAAHEAIEAGEPVRDEPEELLMAADAARLSGHPAQATGHLRRILVRHANDARAPLAAFTLGRVLLDELGRPGEAADAFARARGGGGPLAEDALAREVEARARAGERASARALAEQYLRDYPAGRRERRVRSFGGLSR